MSYFIVHGSKRFGFLWKIFTKTIILKDCKRLYSTTMCMHIIQGSKSILTFCTTRLAYTIIDVHNCAANRNQNKDYENNNGFNSSFIRH